MSYTRTPLLELVDDFASRVGFHVSNNVTHLVTEDYNLDDHNLEVTLQHIADNRQGWISNTLEDISEDDVEVCIWFLNVLKLIPEDVRNAHWENDL